MGTKVEISGLSKRFGGESAVDGVSLDIDDGSFTTLLGPSGCGKTTTLRCIAGLEEPDEGQISIDDRLVSSPSKGTHVSPGERNLGMVFQSHAIWPHMTVEENVEFPLKHQRSYSKDERRRGVKEALQFVDLSQYQKHLATNLSGGQRQRVALARAIVAEPDILLMDEPLSSLDMKLRKELRTEIKRLHDSLDITILYVTHSQDEALYFSDEIAVMNDGKIVERGPTESIYSSPSKYFTMEFLGHTNSIVGEVKQTIPEVVVETPVGTFISDNKLAGAEEGKTATICFRPGEAEFLPNDDDYGDTNIMYGKVVDRMITQNVIDYHIKVNDLVFSLHTLKNLRHQVGDMIKLRIDPSDIRVYSEN